MGFTSFSHAQTQDYIRLVEDRRTGTQQLQTAVESFTRNGVTVDLYGVVHMADQSYYQTIQRDLNQYDTVLYEGIRQGSQPNRETQTLNLVQSGMSRLLGLQFQKDGISYIGSNMVHADIDATTLERNLDGQQLSPLQGLFSPEQIESLKPIFTMLGSLLDEYFRQNPEIQGQLKLQFAQQISQTDISAQLPPQMKKAIIDDRNLIVMNELAVQLRDRTKRRIAIFYGAGHNPDFAQRLLAQGWTRGTKTWRTAWNIRSTR
jgi:hypothetical protein